MQSLKSCNQFKQICHFYEIAGEFVQKAKERFGLKTIFKSKEEGIIEEDVIEKK